MVLETGWLGVLSCMVRLAAGYLVLSEGLEVEEHLGGALVMEVQQV